MKSVSELVSEAERQIENIDVDRAAREIANGDDVVVVDVREPGEVSEHGRISRSVHAPRGMLEFHADPATPYHLEPLHPGRRVIVHCARGSRSALACVTLQQLGYANIANLEGGFEAWRDAGHPVERAA